MTEQLSFSHLVLIGALLDAVAALAVLAVCALTGPRRITTTSGGLALPDVIDVIPEGGADLVVAGHTHGGQVRLPFFGPLVTLTGVPRDVAAGGLHEVNGQAIYVSAGAGMERHNAPQVRFLTRPSVGIVTVT